MSLAQYALNDNGDPFRVSFNCASDMLRPLVQGSVRNRVGTGCPPYENLRNARRRANKNAAAQASSANKKRHRQGGVSFFNRVLSAG
jgi:hypothetical protein